MTPTQKMVKIMAKVPEFKQANPEGWQDDFFTELFEALGKRECVSIALSISNQYPEFRRWLQERGQTQY